MNVRVVLVLLAFAACKGSPSGDAPVATKETPDADRAPGGAAVKPAAEPEPEPAEPAPTAPSGPCPLAMGLVDDGEARVCIDRFEFPGFGEMPSVKVAQQDAAKRCEELGKRLCTEAEWRAACRGPDHLAYPYGKAYRARVCNTSLGPPVKVASAGAFPDCKSAQGIHDLSGNVSEWIATERYTMGGSAADGDDGRCRYKERRSRRTSPDTGFRCCKPPSSGPAPPAPRGP